MNLKIAYFDCFSGASGDMILGALMDCGVSIDTFRSELSRLGLEGFRLEAERVTKAAIGAIQADVVVDGDHHCKPRTLSSIKALINSSDLAPEIKDRAVQIFDRLGEAEAFVHRVSIEDVHFHEVGAIDSIVDIVGAVTALSLLGIDEIRCSPMNVGGGFVKTAHGILPAPAPATLELVKGLPTYSTGMQGELLTPTGAAILSSLASGFGPMPEMTVISIGYGAGKLNLDTPNVVRLIVGEVDDCRRVGDSEPTAVIETNIDDMSPEIYGHVFEKAMNNGALDVSLTTIQMKKNRPGVQLQIICPVSAVSAMAGLIFTETTSIGLRWRIDNRIVANRTIDEVETRFGVVRVKSAFWNGKVVNVAPEYEDCRKLAVLHDVPIKLVMTTASIKASELGIKGKSS